MKKELRFTQENGDVNFIDVTHNDSFERYNIMHENITRETKMVELLKHYSNGTMKQLWYQKSYKN